MSLSEEHILEVAIRPTFWSEFAIPNRSKANLGPVLGHSPLVDGKTIIPINKSLYKL